MFITRIFLNAAKDEKSSLEMFLETAGPIIAGALASGAVEKFLDSAVGNIDPVRV